MLWRLRLNGLIDGKSCDFRCRLCEWKDSSKRVRLFSMSCFPLMPSRSIINVLAFLRSTISESGRSISNASFIFWRYSEEGQSRDSYGFWDLLESRLTNALSSSTSFSLDLRNLKTPRILENCSNVIFVSLSFNWDSASFRVAVFICVQSFLNLFNKICSFCKDSLVTELLLR